MSEGATPPPPYEPDDNRPDVRLASAAQALGEVDPIPAALADIQQRMTVGREARLALTDRVAKIEARMPSIALLRRAWLTTGADGTVTWTFPQAFNPGVVPVVYALAEAPAGSFCVVQLDAAPTNTSARLRVVRGEVRGQAATFSAAAGVAVNVLAIPPT